MRGCGVLHSLAECEPAYSWPDLVASVAEEDYDHCVKLGRDWCCVRDREDRWRRYFLRAVMPFKVSGDDQGCCWGVWVEVPHETYDCVMAHWEDPRQAEHPGFSATLAITAVGYEPTNGLSGVFRMTGPDTASTFVLSTEQDHALALEQARGVDAHRVAEWMHRLTAGS